MNAFLASGYAYELAGIAYYVMDLARSRPRRAARFSKRSQALTLIAAMALVGSAPLHYAASGLGVAVMGARALAALLSTAADARARRGRTRGER